MLWRERNRVIESHYENINKSITYGSTGLIAGEAIRLWRALNERLNEVRLV